MIGSDIRRDHDQIRCIVTIGYVTKEILASDVKYKRARCLWGDIAVTIGIGSDTQLQDNVWSSLSVTHVD